MAEDNPYAPYNPEGGSSHIKLPDFILDYLYDKGEASTGQIAKEVFQQYVEDNVFNTNPGWNEGYTRRRIVPKCLKYMEEEKDMISHKERKDDTGGNPTHYWTRAEEE